MRKEIWRTSPEKCLPPCAGRPLSCFKTLVMCAFTGRVERPEAPPSAAADRVCHEPRPMQSQANPKIDLVAIALVVSFRFPHGGAAAVGSAWYRAAPAMLPRARPLGHRPLHPPSHKKYASPRLYRVSRLCAWRAGQWGMHARCSLFCLTREGVLALLPEQNRFNLNFFLTAEPFESPPGMF